MVLGESPVSEYCTDTLPVFATRDDHVEPELVERSILYPVIAEPPLLEGAVQDRLICDEDDAVDVSPEGDDGTVGVLPEPVPAAFTSTATSSHISPLLAVHLHVTGPAVGTIFELDAPVTVPDMCVFHCCVQVGEPSVTLP